MSVEIARIRKNVREVVRISIDEYRGHKLINLRAWFQTDEGDIRPGRQGVALRFELLDELREALDRAGLAFPATGYRQ